MSIHQFLPTYNLLLLQDEVAELLSRTIYSDSTGKMILPDAPGAYLSDAEVDDFEGVYRTVPNPNLPVRYGRHVENLASNTEDLTQSSWIKSGTASASADDTLLLPATDDLIYQEFSSSSFPSGTPLIARAKFSGSGTVTLRFNMGTGGSANLVITLTSTPTVYALPFTLTGASSFERLYIWRQGSDTATEVTVTEFQIEVVELRITEDECVCLHV